MKLNEKKETEMKKNQYIIRILLEDLKERIYETWIILKNIVLNRQIIICLICLLSIVHLACNQNKFNKRFNNDNPFVSFYITNYNKTKVDTICMLYHDFYSIYTNGKNPLFHNSNKIDDKIIYNIKTRSLFVLSDSMYREVAQDCNIVQKQSNMLLLYESKGILGIIQKYFCINNEYFQFKDESFSTKEFNYLVYLLNNHNIYPYLSDIYGDIFLLDNKFLKDISSKISLCS
ncbi:MAG: hypothetical protein RR303_09790 [Bacteroidales bacterium]